MSGPNDDLERDIRDEDELRRLLRTPDRGEVPSFASVAARASRRSVVPGAIAATAAAVVVIAVGLAMIRPPDQSGAVPSPSASGLTSPTATASPSAAATPTPIASSAAVSSPSPSQTASSLFKPGFGVIYWGSGQGFDPSAAPQVVREGEKSSVGALAGSFFDQFHGAVSPDGRRAIYAAQPQLSSSWSYYLFDGAKPTEQRRLLELPNEIAGPVLWAQDMSAIVFTAQDAGATQGVVPKYDSIRTLDLATGVVKELARITDGSYYQLVGWDKAAGTLAVQINPYPSDGSKKSTYLVIGPSASKSTPMDGPVAYSASADARTVVGLQCTAATGCSLWTWPLADYAARADQHLGSGLSMNVIGFRPNTNEVGLTVFDSAGAGRFALWSPSSGLRDVYQFPSGRSPGGPAFFRADGSALIADFGVPQSLVIDIATGQATALPVADGQTSYSRPAASIRLD